MGEQYLNSKCKFKCPYSASLILTPQNIPPVAVKNTRGEMLTTGTKLSVSVPGGICGSPTAPKNPPSPCVYVQGPVWNNTSKDIKIHGKMALTERSCTTCMSFGGKISPVRPLAISVKRGAVSTGKDHSKGNAPTAENDVQNKNKEAIKEKKQENISQDRPKEAVIGTMEYPQEGCNEKIDFQKEINNLYCPFNAESEKCRNCDYVKTPSEHMLNWETDSRGQKMISTKQPSVILRNNYRMCFPQAEEKEEFEIKRYDLAAVAAHHMVPVKDMLRKQSGERYSSIDFWVKLANYYEYDINEALNCCLLPSARRDVHIGNYSTDQEKEQIKFQIMEILGKQWHGGKGHEYNHYDYSHVVRNLRNYVEQLRKDILNKFGLQSRDVCRADHYEEGREQFEKRMHKLLVNIKDKLDGFRNDPKDSTPYYVSEIAMRYAYGIEGSAKAILFRRIADTKIRVMRILFRKEREQSLEIAWGGEMLLDQQNDNTDRLFMEFCKGSNIAILDERNGNIQLPINFKYVFPEAGEKWRGDEKEGIELLKQNKEEIEKFLLAIQWGNME